ncbi:hypothetical protein DRW41_16215 [Neobacillus piezotolerans]|uniref:Uncharacterized protein n=1 Tax=Neobacillus piezotolerans TaxID=2259171 RepID=A0A3D8GN79_9BACI|nr:hypothetical protein [Neobacillus piezotolerans]RDU35689.1 hypothetical protein DRW41_16215 [Neobacillus piezotolerans]
MKKTVLPTIIILLSVFLINIFIQKDIDKETIVAKNMPVPVIQSGNQSVEPVLLFKDNGKITKTLVDKAVHKAHAVNVNPYGEVEIKLPDNDAPLKLSEWDPKTGRELQPFEGGYIPVLANEPGTRVIIIRVETDAGPAVYLGKINVLKLYSFQELLHPAGNVYTILVFSEGESGIREVPSGDETKYVTREVRGTVAEFKEKYHGLDIKNLPTIYVFHQGAIIFRSEDMKELQSFITDISTTFFLGESENWQVELRARQNLSEGTAELFITYKGQDEKPKKMDFHLSGRGWSWGSSGKIPDESGKIFSSSDMRYKLSEIDSIPIELTWDGKKEEIILAYRKNPY